MKKNKIFNLFSILFLASCDAINTETDFAKGYNKNLWFKNDLETTLADPFILYEDGYYYMYGTSDELSGTGFYVYRSNKLNYWENLGPAFLSDPYSWSSGSLWAPNVYKIGDKYYMYYCAKNSKDFSSTNLKYRRGISVAVSSSPIGPFKEYEGYDANGNYITKNDQVFLDLGFAAIDPSIFIDDNGEMYMYFSQDQLDSESKSYGVKLIDPVTADYSTLKPLLRAGYKSINDDEINPNLKWERGSSTRFWNEAPELYKSNGKYYLTYSANYYGNITYAVGYAVGDSPLGEFNKPASFEYENQLCGVQGLDIGNGWDFTSGTGHHCFFKAGDELMIGYHAHLDRASGSSSRAFAMDRVVVNEDGSLFVNGPTYSLQPLPSSISGYENIALRANLSGSGISDINKLNDYKIPMHIASPRDLGLEYSFNPGSNEVKLLWNRNYDISAIAIYGGMDKDYVIDKINIKVGSKQFNNIELNHEYYKDYFNEFNETGYLRPGSPYVAEFESISSNEVTVSFYSNKEARLSEIVVLAKGENK